MKVMHKMMQLFNLYKIYLKFKTKKKCMKYSKNVLKR